MLQPNGGCVCDTPWILQNFEKEKSVAWKYTSSFLEKSRSVYRDYFKSYLEV